MNYSDRFLREIASFSPLDVMLADIAVRIQLSPTDYQLAIDHSEAINDWIDREESPLRGLIEAFYGQGGFAIGATVARHATDDEFDIDMMAQVSFPQSVDPETPLALMDEAIRGEPGSRYYKKTERKTRCSTVHDDGMHLDVTPAVRIIGREEKISLIFHSKPSDPAEPKLSLLANPSGFAEWFLSQTPPDEAFREFFERRSLDYERARLLIKADMTPVPDQMPVYRKSRAVIALQLTKRWRNLGYDRRHKSLRRPPSVLLAYDFARNANRTRTLADELIHQVECVIVALEAAEAGRETVREFNPRCKEDELTDRWPCDLSEQRVFIDDLRAFAAQLYRLRQGVPLPEMQRILEDLFGRETGQRRRAEIHGPARRRQRRRQGSSHPGSRRRASLGLAGSAVDCADDAKEHAIRGLSLCARSPSRNRTRVSGPFTRISGSWRTRAGWAYGRARLRRSVRLTGFESAISAGAYSMAGSSATPTKRSSCSIRPWGRTRAAPASRRRMSIGSTFPLEFPPLCLYDPAQREWSPNMFIADTIIPWTIKWLLFFEDWLGTGHLA